MPCHDYSSSSEILAEYREKVDLLTRLLCRACRLIALHQITIPADTELGRWWDRHQKLDAKRIKEERVLKKYNEALKAHDANRPKRSDFE